MKKIVYFALALTCQYAGAAYPEADLSRLHRELTSLASQAAGASSASGSSLTTLPHSSRSAFPSASLGAAAPAPTDVARAAKLIEQNYQKVVGTLTYSLVLRGAYSWIEPADNAAFLADVQTLIELLKEMDSDQRVEALGCNYTALDWLGSIYESQVGDGGRFGFSKIVKIFARDDLDSGTLAGQIAANLRV
jgi:hypothetical protein